MSERWRPLSVRKAGKEKEHDALVDGVPPWLAKPLWDWVVANFLLITDDFRGNPVNGELLKLVQLHLRVALDWSSADKWALESLQRQCLEDGGLFLSLIDLALHGVGNREDHKNEVAFLEAMLEKGGSAWSVAPDRRALTERVAPAAAEAARAAMEGRDRASSHLGEAWRHAHGRNPHPGTAYREAVRAIEAAARPVIAPNDATATLGKMIGELRGKPQLFETVFADITVSPLDVVRSMMALVWTNQLDRHGTDDESVPLHVSQEQADAAVQAAVTLVQWLRRGVVRRVK